MGFVIPMSQQRTTRNGQILIVDGFRFGHIR